MRATGPIDRHPLQRAMRATGPIDCHPLQRAMRATGPIDCHPPERAMRATGGGPGYGAGCACPAILRTKNNRYTP